MRLLRRRASRSFGQLTRTSSVGCADGLFNGWAFAGRPRRAWRHPRAPRASSRLPGTLIAVVRRHRDRRSCSHLERKGVPVVGDLPRGIPSPALAAPRTGPRSAGARRRGARRRVRRLRRHERALAGDGHPPPRAGRRQPRADRARAWATSAAGLFHGLPDQLEQLANAGRRVRRGADPAHGRRRRGGDDRSSPCAAPGVFRHMPARDARGHRDGRRDVADRHPRDGAPAPRAPQRVRARDRRDARPSRCSGPVSGAVVAVVAVDPQLPAPGVEAVHRRARPRRRPEGLPRPRPSPRRSHGSPGCCSTASTHRCSSPTPASSPTTCNAGSPSATRRRCDASSSPPSRSPTSMPRPPRCSSTWSPTSAGPRHRAALRRAEGHRARPRRSLRRVRRRHAGPHGADHR